MSPWEAPLFLLAGCPATCWCPLPSTPSPVVISTPEAVSDIPNLSGPQGTREGWGPPTPATRHLLSIKQLDLCSAFRTHPLSSSLCPLYPPLPPNQALHQSIGPAKKRDICYPLHLFRLFPYQKYFILPKLKESISPAWERDRQGLEGV